MSKIFKYIREEYKLVVPFILTVINAQFFEIYLRSAFANTLFIQSPYFLTIAISVNMLIASVYIFITLWSRTKIDSSSRLQINQDMVKYYKTSNGDLPDYNISCFDNIMDIERSIESGSEIWILTENLKDDIYHPIVSKVVEENIKKGVVYTYFLVVSKQNPDETLLFQKGVLEEKYKKYVNKRIKFVIINDETLLIPETYLVLYNANSNSNRDGYLAVEIGDNSKNYMCQSIKGHKLYSIYNFLRDKKVLNKLISPPNNTKKQANTKNNTNINTVAIIFDILYLLVTVFFLNAISLPPISSFETVFQIALPTLILISFSTLSISFIDKIIRLNRRNVEEIIGHNKIYDSLLSGVDSVVKELEKKYLSKKKETLKEMKLVTPTEIYSCIKSYKKVYILTSLSNEVLSEEFRCWMDKLIQLENKIQFIFLVHHNDTTTLGKFEYIEEWVHSNEKNIVIKQIVETNYFSLNPFDILFCVGSKTNDSSAYVVLGTDEFSIYRKIDQSYVDICFISKMLGRIKKIPTKKINE